MEPRIPFQPLTDLCEVKIYDHGLLPHWRIAGATYFVTFRQADSLPQVVLHDLKDEREEWLQCHDIDPRHRYWKRSFAALPGSEKREYERLVSTKLNVELDRGLGSCLLGQREVASVVSKALKHFHGQRAYTGDFVIMPNHVHVLMTPIAPWKLEDLLHSVKSFTATQINRLHSREGPFWQQESYDHLVRDVAQLGRVQEYIRSNPSKAKLKCEEWMVQQAAYDLVR